MFAMSYKIKPGLFGIRNSNRDLTQKETWGKNQFNNLFPAALACYMHYKGLDPAYLLLDKDLRVIHKTIPVADLFRIQPDSKSIFFAFERDFPPYQKLVVGSLPRVDLVIINKDNNQCLQRLEIKLTALPDNSTCEGSEDKYSCEIVVRPDSVIYLALSIIEIFEGRTKELAAIVGPTCTKIADWVDADEIRQSLSDMISMIDILLVNNIDKQSPLLIQPVWKTDGKSAILHDNCLDAFVWSDFAFTRLFVDVAKEELARNMLRISRHTRTVVWLVRMLYDFANREKVDYATIIDEISLSTKNDKAFAVSGRVTHPYLSSNILKKPRIAKNDIKNIILGGGQDYLSPERRFDAIIKNTPGLFD